MGEISVSQLLNYLIPHEVDKIDYRSYRRLLHCYLDWETLIVGDIMASEVPTLAPTVTLEEAVRVFRRTGRAMLYIVEGGRIQGAIYVSDLCKALIERKKTES